MTLGTKVIEEAQYLDIDTFNRMVNYQKNLVKLINTKIFQEENKNKSAKNCIIKEINKVNKWLKKQDYEI